MKADIVLGLGFGDEGKGATVDYLCSRSVAPVVVVRFNGGAQCAHNVVLPNGIQHTFRQFGSGTLRGAATHLTKDVLVNPVLLNIEMGVLRANVPRLDITLDRDALVTNAYHIAINRSKVLGTNASCGLGINETVCAFESAPESALRVGDLVHPSVVKEKLDVSRKRAECLLGNLDGKIPFSRLCEAYAELGRQWESSIIHGEQFFELYKYRHWIFEGAQGALLDQKYGFYPYVTRSNTTADNALAFIQGVREVRKVGVMRSYMTRHGAGPMPTESKTSEFFERHNGWNPMQGPWRVGALDGPLIRYALSVVGGVDTLAVNHLDVVKNAMFFCIHNEECPSERDESTSLERQRELGERLKEADTENAVVGEEEWIPFLEEYFGIPVGIRGAGPTAQDRSGA